MRNWLMRWVASAVALFIITQLHIGIESHSIGATLLVVVILGLANSLVRPIIMFFVWPLNCLTCGLLGFAVNVALFFIAGNMVKGFEIHDPFKAAIGLVLMSTLSGLFNFVLKDRGERDNR